MKRRLLLVLLVAAITASTASAQSIGLFFDPDAASCSGTIPYNSVNQIYIIALLSGPVAGGMTAAEFRVTGLPSGWNVLAEHNPAINAQIGDPFDGVGCAVAFPVCQPGPTVLLFTVHLGATTVVSDHYLRVRSRNPPTNPDYACPLVTKCDNPEFTKVCMLGGEAIINPTGPGCTVAVQPLSWSTVKSLYD